MKKQLSPFKRITRRAVRDFYRKLEKARCPYPLPPPVRKPEPPVHVIQSDHILTEEEIREIERKDKSFTAVVPGFASGTCARAAAAHCTTPLGVDPYEDEIEDGVPCWFYALMIGLLMFLGWFQREDKSSTAAVPGYASGTVEEI